MAPQPRLPAATALLASLSILVASCTATEPIASTTTTVPTTTVPGSMTTTAAPSPLPDTESAAAMSLTNVDLATVAENLWLLMPTREDAADILGMSDHSVFWWDTESPWIATAGDWWSVPAWGAGHITMMRDGSRDTALQFGVYETIAEAQAALEAMSGHARFTSPTRLIDLIELPRDLDGFAVALDRAADEGFEPEPEALADPEYVSHMERFDQTWFAVLQFDRVVAVVAMHGDGDEDPEPLTRLTSVVAERASRFGDLVANPTARPSRASQALPQLIFGGTGLTWEDLRVPTSYTYDGWSVRPCGSDARCLEMARDGQPVRRLDLAGGVPWGRLDSSTPIEQSLENLVGEVASTRGTDATTEFRHFIIAGAPAVRAYTEFLIYGDTPAAAIDVYIVAGNPLATFHVHSWGEFDDDIDPALVRGAVPLIDQLLTEAEGGR